MPWLLIRTGVAREGRRDCGDHEWYSASDEEERCHHCEAGTRRDSAGVSASWREDIAAHGWLVVHVPDGDHGPFHYTAGLTAHHLAELIVYGLPEGTGAALLNDLAQRLRDGEQIIDGEPVVDLVDGDYRVGLHTAARLVDPLGVVTAVFDDGPVAVRQLVVPDPSNRMPWESGYSPVQQQPLLFTVSDQR